MANNYSDIVLYGFSNIQIKKEGEISYRPLIGGISVQANISTETMTATNATRTFTLVSTTKAEGQLTLLELTLDDRALLFGHTVKYISDMKTLEVSDTDIPPTFSLKFERQKASGGKIIYELPSVTFKSNSIEANTLQQGEVQEDTITIDFTINKEDEILYRIYEN